MVAMCKMAFRGLIHQLYAAKTRLFTLPEESCQEERDRRPQRYMPPS